MDYFAIFEGLRLINVVEIDREKPNELLRLIETYAIAYEGINCKMIDQETYLILKGALINGLN